MNKENIFTFVSTLEKLKTVSGPFMPGLLLTEPAAVQLVKMQILKPNILIPVKSEHHFGQRIYGVTYNIFDSSLLCELDRPHISEILDREGFRRLSSNLRCYEIIAPSYIDVIAQLAMQ